VKVPALAKELGIHRTSVNRRVNRALTLGYLNDLSGGGRGRAKELVPSYGMPEDTGVLPDPSVLTGGS
jgi:hypothetical protein